MASHGNPEKAKKYLKLLDEARCNGNWSDIPELTRKIGKHAPQRKCLVLTARAEGESALKGSRLPNTAAPPKANLEAAIDGEKEFPEDRYQAQTCLSSLILAAGEKEPALNVLTDELPPGAGDSEKEEKWQRWTYVAAIRNALIREMCQSGPRHGEMRTPPVCRLIQDAPSSVAKTPQFQAWAEKLLTRVCNAEERRRYLTRKSVPDSIEVEMLLAPFRAWGRFWAAGPATAGRVSLPIEQIAKRRQIWKLYYQLLSHLLREGYVYPSASDDEKVLSKARQAQSSEIRKVEAIYEQLLIRDTAFPEASVINVEVDEWTDMLMADWSITCGSSWTDEDLGPGGQEAASRSVLEMLYRAAAKTFHSTTVLRHLITVHASLAEFELASKALDSYLDIVVKAKERTEKSGKAEAGMDNDSLMLQTIASGILMLCTFGRNEHIARAHETSKVLEEWLVKYDRDREMAPVDSHTLIRGADSIVPGKVLALVNRAIGISKASWARVTLETHQRGDLQSEAKRRLRNSLIADAEEEDDPRTLYALALLSAETRDIEGAIAITKHALSSQSRTATNLAAASEGDLKGRQLITESRVNLVQCWHLLALLLSARHEFEKAETACDAAIESFDNFGVLPGELRLQSLSVFEKQHILESKMTQMALAEINDGAGAAVNAGTELLSLYAQIFDPPKEKGAKTEVPSIVENSNGVKGGSFFGRSKSTRTAGEKSINAGSVYSKRISDDTTRPPTISITDSDFPSTTQLEVPRMQRSPSHKLQKRASKRSVNSGRNPSPARPHSGLTEKGKEQKSKAKSVTDSFQDDNASSKLQPPALGTSITQDTESDLNGATDTPSSSEEEKLTGRHPPFNIIPPRFSSVQQDRYAQSLLCNIWVFVAGLYRRADMFDDSQGAADEAVKLAKRIEENACAEGFSAQELQLPNWGSGKSVNEIWADIYAEQGELLLSRSEQYNAIEKFELSLSLHPNHPTATVCLSELLLDIYAKKLAPPSTGAKEHFDPAANDPKPRVSQPMLDAVNPLPAKSDTPLRDLSRQPSAISAVRPDTSSFPVLEDSAIADDEDGDSKSTTSSSPSDSSASLDTFGPAQKKKPSSGKKEEKHHHHRGSDPDAPDKTPSELDRVASRDRAFGLLTSLTKLGSGWDSSAAWFALARAYELSGQAERARDVLWWVVELEDKNPVRGWACLGQGYAV